MSSLYILNSVQCSHHPTVIFKLSKAVQGRNVTNRDMIVSILSMPLLILIFYSRILTF
jgi:hypothetical protein